jgi:hypothetical protein
MPFIYLKLADIVWTQAQFILPKEQLAYRTRFEEADFQSILAEPLSIVIEVLQRCTEWDEVLCNLPDVTSELWEQYGLVV